jgi:hypothetical protein
VSVEEQKKDRGGYLLMAKGLKRSRFIEVIAYCAIVLSLISGILNYGFRLRGNIEVATVGSLKDLDSVQPLSLRLRASEINYATADRPPSIAFELLKGDRDSGRKYRLEQGEGIRHGFLNMRYDGDYFIAFLTVMRGGLDYRPVPVRLVLSEGASKGMYHGDITMRVPGVRGEAEYEPGARKFRIRIYRKEELEFETEFLYGTTGKRWLLWYSLSCG